MKIRLGARHAFYLLTAWLWAVFSIVTGHFADPDLWGRLSMGALFFQNGRFPYRDIFSYTAYHAKWVDHEWLTGLVFYQVLANFGETGFLAFKYLLVLGIFGLIFRLHRKGYQASPLYAFYGLVLSVEAYIVGMYATVRSHMFSFLFVMLFIYLLERVRLGQNSRRSLWLLPLLGLLWGNLHGGFIMGMLLLGCYGLGEMLRQRAIKPGLPYWGLAGLILLLVGVVSPYGLSYLPFLAHAWTLDRSHIGEWSAMRFDSWYFLCGQILVVLGAMMPILRWALRDRQDSGAFARLITPALVLFWLVAMTLKGVRFQPFLALALIAYSPVFLSPEFLKRVLPTPFTSVFRSHASAFCKLLPGLIAVLTIGGFFYMRDAGNPLRVVMADELSVGAHLPIRYPLGAIHYLEKSPYRGNLSVRFGYGEFAYWRLYPRFKVAMDGRYEEVYSQREFLLNDAFYETHDPFLAQKAAHKISEDNTEFVLTETSLPNLGLLLQSGQWELLYGDNCYALLGKKTTLAKFKPYHPPGFLLSDKIYTLGDFVTPADLKRFKTRDY